MPCPNTDPATAPERGKDSSLCWGLSTLDNFPHKAPTANSINSKHTKVTHSRLWTPQAAELGFEPGLSDLNSFWVPGEAAHSREPPGLRYHAPCQGESEGSPRIAQPGKRPAGCQAARIAGSCRHLAGHYGGQAAGPITMVTTAKALPACCALQACIDAAARLPFWVWEMAEGGGRQTPVPCTLPKPVP